MSKELKKKHGKELKKELDGKAIILFDYDGVSVEDFGTIRKGIRESGGQVKVVKNTILQKILQEEQISYEWLKGMTGMTFMSDDDFMTCSNVLYKSQKDEKITIKGGLYEGSKVDNTYIVKMASIPSRDTLYSSLVGCLQGVVANLVYTLDDIGKQKEEKK